MKSSMWGILFLTLGLTGIVLINIFGEVTIKNEQNFYSLKEVTKAAMEDAVDEFALEFGVGYDGVTQTTDPKSMHCDAHVKGTVRIIKERFVELFILKFAESVNVDNDYEIIFNDIDECPPKVSVTVKSTQAFSDIQRIIGFSEEDTVEDASITNVIHAILESEKDFDESTK